MSRVSDREYQLAADLMQCDKRCNLLLKDNEKLEKWIAGNNNEIECLKRKILELENIISGKLKPSKGTKKPSLALKQ